MRRGSPSTSSTISPTPVAATVPMMPLPRRTPKSPVSPSPNAAIYFSAAGGLVEQHDYAVGGDDQVARFLQRQRATRSRSRSAASFSEKL